MDIYSYRKAGNIVKIISKELQNIVSVGYKLLDIAEFIEKRIVELGGKPAFPVNIGINDITAHYTPDKECNKSIEDGDIVKIDFGVHINGYIADYAYTFCNERNDMINVANDVLSEVIKRIKIGISISEIGSFIEDYIHSRGFGVIRNLSGHGLKRYELHAFPNIPNISSNIEYKLQKGDVIAIEPFVCQRDGIVKESSIKEIYGFIKRKPVRNFVARKIMEEVEIKYNKLPFAVRWLKGNSIRSILNELEKIGCINSYPVLREANQKLVAQFEHTIIIKDKIEIITL